MKEREFRHFNRFVGDRRDIDAMLAKIESRISQTSQPTPVQVERQMKHVDMSGFDSLVDQYPPLESDLNVKGDS